MASSPPPQAAANSARIRPWQLFFDVSALSLPVSLSEASYRVTQNLRYFLPNYAVLFLLVFLLGLVYKPLSLLLFLCIFAAWIYLVFWRDDPVTLFDVDIDQNIVLGLLVVITLVALFLTRLWLRFSVSLIIGVLIVIFHGMLRAPENSMEDSPYGSLLSGVDSPSGEYVSV